MGEGPRRSEPEGQRLGSGRCGAAAGQRDIDLRSAVGHGPTADAGPAQENLDAIVRERRADLGWVLRGCTGRLTQQEIDALPCLRVATRHIEVEGGGPAVPVDLGGGIDQRQAALDVAGGERLPGLHPIGPGLQIDAPRVPGSGALRELPEIVPTRDQEGSGTDGV